ncbi:MAG TPA: asparagine synthase (glutamine-hydrolyzing) [Bacteroidia bacterium]|nr:asparagine synthase (glutamine-hydrolyzing) [Bacteroidia bacterium]
MCGILGYYKAGGLRKEDILRAQRALRALNHRGPDSEGICLIDSHTGKSWTYQTADTPSDITTDWDAAHYPEGSADLLLAQRRLSIFDLSSRGFQPMRDQKGNVIIFNGEIYNWVELRDELKNRAHRFSTETDTEVVLAAYRQWGPECLQRFNGMWSMVIWDAIQQRVFVANDRIGIKQLYQWGNAEEWMLASEIKAIRTLPHGPKELDADTVDFFLRHGQIDLTTQTTLRDVQRFQPGHFVKARVQEITKAAAQPYWDFPTTGVRKISLEDATQELRFLLDDAIRLRMRSDVPWGTTLSGGLDSSSIIYAAHKLRLKLGHSSPIRTFTAVFPGKEGDESAFVRFIQGELGLDASYTNPLERFDFADFERFMYHQDQPVVSTSMYAQWSVMKAVGQSDVKVLLDGQGGDELFGGYHHHFYKYARALLLQGKLGAFNLLVEEYCLLKGWDIKQVKQTVRNDVKLFVKLKMGSKMPGPPQITAWNAASSLVDVLKLDLRSFIMPSLLRYEDRNSMAFGIEARLPFLDYRIVEFALTLPDEYKIREGWQKFILRRAMPELPEKIRFRKDKKGFTTPHEEWMTQYRDRFEAYARAALAGGAMNPWPEKELSQLDSKQLFRMASLGAWMETV